MLIRDNSANYFSGKIKAARDNTRVIIYYILEQSKEAKLEFSKGTISING